LIKNKIMYYWNNFWFKYEKSWTRFGVPNKSIKIFRWQRLINVILFLSLIFLIVKHYLYE